MKPQGQRLLIMNAAGAKVLCIRHKSRNNNWLGWALCCLISPVDLRDVAMSQQQHRQLAEVE
jgi:hypothetical protein